MTDEAAIERAARALARNAGWADGEKLVHANHGPAIMLNGYSVMSARAAVPVWRLFVNDARLVFEALKA